MLEEKCKPPSPGLCILIRCHPLRRVTGSYRERFVFAEDSLGEVAQSALANKAERSRADCALDLDTVLESFAFERGDPYGM